MDPDKPWYRSKLKWGGIVAGLAIAMHYAPVEAVRSWAPFVGALAPVLAAFGQRDALSEIQAAQTQPDAKGTTPDA